MTIEGIIPLSVFMKMEPYLQAKGYLYKAINPFTKKIIGQKLMDNYEYDLSKGFETVIRTDEDDYRCFDDSAWIKLSPNIRVSTNIRYCLLVKDDHEDDYPSCEVLDYTSEKLFINENPLISIIIEDPAIARITLYKEILNLLITCNN